MDPTLSNYKKAYFLKATKEWSPGIHFIKKTNLEKPKDQPFIISKSDDIHIKFDVVEKEIPYNSNLKTVVFLEQEIRSPRDDDFLKGYEEIIKSHIGAVSNEIRRIDGGISGITNNHIQTISRRKVGDSHSVLMRRFEIGTQLDTPVDLSEMEGESFLRFTTLMQGYGYNLDIYNIDMEKLPYSLGNVIF